MKKLILSALGAMAFSFSALATEPILQEAPMLAQQVVNKKIPSLYERLPENPAIADYRPEYKQVGSYGGTLRMLVGRAKDVRLMVVYGYARLVGYDENFKLKADILETFEVKDQREFTFKLRKGHKWSDGHPFTSEDFRYYWEDMLRHDDWKHSPLPRELVVNGKGPKVEIIDELTVKYSWDEANPYFLLALARPNPLLIYRPAHYLKNFHVDYRPKDELEAQIKLEKQRHWIALHFKYDRLYKNDNPDMPTLQPWVNTTPKPASRYIFVRNPFFHRIDPNGKQLPYLDRVAMTVASARLIPAKTGSGESDLQGRALNFSNYTFLKQGEKNNNYRVNLWRSGKGAHLALYPNMTTKDDLWRNLFQDVRVRRALSLAINRHEINQVIYFGLAQIANNCIVEHSPLYDDDQAKRWTDFDLTQANALLDQAGLDKRDDDGIRLLPDGRPAELIVEMAGDSREQSDVMELIHDSWLQAGIKIYTKSLQRDVFRNRAFAGQSKITLWFGADNGVPTAITPPDEWVPRDQYQLQWPRWGMYVDSHGKSGEISPLPAVRKLMELNKQWLHEKDKVEKKRIWQEILDINTDQVFAIGLVSGVPYPVVVHEDLRNVPHTAIYNWATSAQFGVYRPDTFWFDRSGGSIKQSGKGGDVNG